MSVSLECIKDTSASIILINNFAGAKNIVLRPFSFVYKSINLQKQNAFNC